ncbi:MAG: hypothetical protein ABIW76_21035 [Fibrobacteria bacterium]
MGLYLAAATVFLAGGAMAQVTWQSTHTDSTVNGYATGACGLESSTLKVSIHSAYLDVEEDAELSALGNVDPGSATDPKTLEITGIFTLPPGSAVIGALLWDGTKILQGKLLDRQTADSLYEAIVDRNSKPPLRPRDPLVLELMAKDTYRFRIYPVAAGHSRRIRLRYQLPPTLGSDGIELALRAAIAPLYRGSPAQISVTFQGSGKVKTAILATSQGARTQMTLPRTRLMVASDLADNAVYDYYRGWIFNPGTRLLAADPVRQMMVRTSFSEGQMAGNYLNLYAGVTKEVLRGLKLDVEAVVLWKWQNPANWTWVGPYGEEASSASYDAANQAAFILNMYDNIGAEGTRIGLLHDDAKAAPHAFKVANRNQPEYTAAVDYLRSVSGSYPYQFAQSLRPIKGSKPGKIADAIVASKSRFVSDLRLVKTLYSSETGTIRHLIILTAGTDYESAETDLNATFDSLFQDEPVSIGSQTAWSLNQTGFAAQKAARDHAYKGSTISTAWGEFPGHARLNLNVVVRNSKQSYDFGISCQGGLAYACDNLIFHGKSDAVWKDSLGWEAYDEKGKAIGATMTKPVQIDDANDTAVAVLWAGSGSAFSDKKELPLGPVYGFVDRWASLLSLQKDSLGSGYSDSGVPRIANVRLQDVIPNYDGDYRASAIVVPSRIPGLGNPDSWRIELSHGGLIIRIPGMNGNLSAELELYDLSGKRAGHWNARPAGGMFRVDASGVRSGVYLLKIRVGGIQSVKRILL